MSSNPRGKHAFGYCDKTGFRYPIAELVEEYENGVATGLLVGKDVVDPDHPQLRLREVDANDPQTLLNPRPDQSQAESRSLWSWNPVGHPLVKMTAEVGTVTVSIS